MKITKLDRRFNGFPHWTHKVEIYGYNTDGRSKADRNRYELRKFLTQNFGPGCEVSELFGLMRTGIEPPIWGWNVTDVYVSKEAHAMLALSLERWEKDYAVNEISV